MKKLVHIIHGLNTGGAETLVKEYVLRLDKKEYDITVICFDHCNESPYESLLKEENIRVIYLCDCYKKWKKFCGLQREINIFFQLRRLIKEIDPDIIHTHLFINTYLLFALPSKNVRLLHTVHNEPMKLWFPSIGAKKDAFVRRIDFIAAMILTIRNKQRFIVLHDGMRVEVNQLFGVDDSIVLNNGIDFTRYNISSNSEALRRSMGIEQDAFIIGHIGRFTEQKNQGYLVKIFSEIIKQNNKALLLMVGSGPLRDNVEHDLYKYGLGGRFLILENRSDIPELLKLMNVFVFPSIYEGLGIVLVEAQAAHLPCVISDRVPQAAVISNLVTRVSLEQDVKYWANSILNVKKPDCIDIAEDEWDICAVVQKLSRIYQGM